jgi:broad specificity phosphatase PhoE
MMTRLILIRHGITEWNIQKRYCGYRDVSLSKQGKAQAVKLRKDFKNICFDKIYCSDRKRALMTRAILFGKADFIKEKDLREIHFGVLEGLKHDEIVKKYGEVYNQWLLNPYKNRIPKAEAMQVFKKRIQKAIKKIVRLNRGKTIAVVCHGGVIGIFVSSILKSDDFWKHVPSPASATVVEHKNNKYRIVKFNYKTHF